MSTTLLTILFLGCGDSAPDYKASRSSKPAIAPEPIPKPQEADQTLSPLALGKKLYLERCASCHNTIAESNKIGLTAGKILDSYTKIFPSHSDVEWPTADEAYALELALSKQL